MSGVLTVQIPYNQIRLVFLNRILSSNPHPNTLFLVREEEKGRCCLGQSCPMVFLKLALGAGGSPPCTDRRRSLCKSQTTVSFTCTALQHSPHLGLCSHTRNTQRRFQPAQSFFFLCFFSHLRSISLLLLLTCFN